MILLIDNYDSFTYNLAAFLSAFDEVRVVRNDRIRADQVRALRPARIVLSPGPGGPESAGACLPILRELGGEIPLLGVCLGHQCVGAAFGARVVRAERPCHGKASPVFHDGTGLFQDIPSPFPAGRYHSLVVEPSSLPEALEATAFTEEGEIMALRHRTRPLFGVQFHPESILTENGRTLLRNFCALPGSGEGPRGRKEGEPSMFRKHLERVSRGRALEAEEMEEAMDLILEGKVPEVQTAGFLYGLRSRGETVEEIAAAARALRRRALRVETGRRPLLDTCGTGGDGGGTFNVSTAAAFVAAGAGVPVAKHGNRAVSGRCGSADVLEALGVPFPASPREVRESLDEAGLAFLFAPAFHGAMRHVAGVRRKLGVRTIFNLLGPLINPAGATCQVVGVYDPGLLRPFAEVLRGFGLEGVLAVHGFGGLDELSPEGPNRVAELRDGTIEEYDLSPEDAGLSRAPAGGLGGGTAEENARILREVLSGAPGPRRDATLLNGAAALIAAGAVPAGRGGNDPARWREAVRRAAESVDSGRAAGVLSRMTVRPEAAAPSQSPPFAPEEPCFLRVVPGNRIVPSSRKGTPLGVMA